MRYTDFRTYFDGMVNTELAAAPFQRAVVNDVLWPQVGPVPKQAFWPAVALTTELLPPRVRELFGLELTPARHRVAMLMRTAVRGMLPVLPRVLREQPQARGLRGCPLDREERRCMSDFEHVVPVDGIRRFLDERFGASDAPIAVTKLGEGHSNLTFTLRRGEDAWVLRRPPRGDILPGTHEMHREFNVMKALSDSGSVVPVPRPIELCEDDSYIGAPFYLMDHVDGVVVRGAPPSGFDSRDARRRMGEELVDRLADISLVDWQGDRSRAHGAQAGAVPRAQPEPDAAAVRRGAPP